jgi:stage V sporulation protein D (sporulation-specific penicillin-binding protein)
MMNIAMRMGPEIFYKYIKNYGFGQKTGVTLDGEEVGIINESSSLQNMVNFVTIGFGQGIAVTPIQMMSALNSAINGGHLYKPTLVKSVIDGVSQTVKIKNDATEIRQTISEGTSRIMRDILAESGAHTVGLADYLNLEIGGKTGTAQKFINGTYAQGKNVTSFYGFAPYYDPKLSVLVVVDEATGNNQSGSTVAAPVGGEIFKKTLKYITGKQPDEQNIFTIIPNVIGKTKEEAARILEINSINYRFNGDEQGVVSIQSDVATQYEEGTVIELTVQSVDGTKVSVPDLAGMSVQQVNNVLKAHGLELNVEGGGIAYEQSVPKNTEVDKGTKVTVKFRYIE